jgi:glycosyltransferase involved in cell wall biosynthesis
MKVGLIRGAYLSQFEMQTFEQMPEDVELTAYRIRSNRFDTDIIDVPIRDLWCIDEPFSLVSGRAAFYFNLFLQATCGLDYYHFRLVNELADKDIAHTMETFNAFSHQALQAKRKHGTRLAVTVWENRPFAAERFSAKRRMKYEVLHNADLLLAMTPRAAECLKSEGADESRIVIQPPGINLERFSPRPRPADLAEEHGVESDDFVFLSVAALRWEKGVYDLLYAFHRLVNRTGRSDLKLIYAGSGPAEKELRRRAGRLALSDQVMITRFPYEDMHRAYNLADAFVLASAPRRGWLEQFGYVLPEALASGVPIITTRSGSIPEVTGEAALLMPPADFLAMARNMEKLLTNQDLRERLGRKGRERAEQQYDCRKNAQEIKKAYERIL